MKWAKTLRLFSRKRTQQEASSGYEDDDTSEVRQPEHSDDSFSSKPKRRSVSIEPCCASSEAARRQSVERKRSLDLWHEARRARNSIDVQPSTVTTAEKLTISKAGCTTLLNRKYLAIKHLGSGTFGRVTLCLNISNQKLYAVKTCRKPQLASCGSSSGRCSQISRFRRSGGLGSGASGSTFSRAFGEAPAGSAVAISCNAQGSTTGALAHTSHPGPVSRRSSFRTVEAIREIAVMKKLHNPNIVQLVEVIDDPRANSLLLVMEYVEGRTLEQKRVNDLHWERMPEPEIWQTARQVLQGLDYLHDYQIVHGDLKPANLLLDSNSNLVKIVDFGSSKMYSDKAGSAASPAFSTPAFRSPESLLSGYQLSFEMDMWALGVCIYMWAFGKLPFNGRGPFAIYESIRNNQLVLPEDPSISAELRDLLSKLLDKDVCARLDVCGALQHPWVTAHGQAPLVARARPRAVLPNGHGVGGRVTVTQEELDAAVVELDDGVEDLMAELFEEEVFVDREHLVTAGQLASKVYLIAKGEVEIYQDCHDAPDSPNQPFISGSDTEIADAQEHDFSDINQDCLAGALAPWPPGRKVLVTKGPGESIGLPCLSKNCPHAHVWKASVRAKGHVRAFVAEVENIRRLVEQHPVVAPAVEQMVVQQTTDLLVTEAMRQLKLFNGSMIAQQAPAQAAQPHMVAVSAVC